MLQFDCCYDMSHMLFGDKKKMGGLGNYCVKLNRDVDIRWIFYARMINHI